MTYAMERNLELYEARGDRYVVCDGKVFRPNGALARPDGPICFDYNVSSDQAKYIMGEIGCRALLTTDGFSGNQASPWYAVICRKFRRLDDYKAKYRSEIRRGLRNCTAQQIDGDYLTKHGYDVYRKAFARYTGSPTSIWSEQQFVRFVEITAEFGDIEHFWGVFHEGSMIAYAMNDLFPKTQVTYWAIKMDPAYTSQYPVYALMYSMNEYYLGEQGYEYANDGWRSIRHETNIQDFLIKKFNFEKAHSNIQIMYDLPTSMVARLGYPLRGPLGRMCKPLKTFFSLEEIRRDSRRTFDQ